MPTKSIYFNTFRTYAIFLGYQLDSVYHQVVNTTAVSYRKSEITGISVHEALRSLLSDVLSLPRYRECLSYDIFLASSFPQ